MKISTVNVSSIALPTNNNEGFGLKKYSGIHKNKPTLPLDSVSKKTKILIADEVLLMKRKIEANSSVLNFLNKHPGVWSDILREEDEYERKELFNALMYDSNLNIDGVDFNMLSV